MELRWTREAAADLERIADYLFEHAPEHAERLVLVLYEAPATLLTLPNRGRLGKKEGTRELVMSPLPYIVVYTMRGTPSTSFASCMRCSNGRNRARAPIAIDDVAPPHTAQRFEALHPSFYRTLEPPARSFHGALPVEGCPG